MGLSFALWFVVGADAVTLAGCMITPGGLGWGVAFTASAIVSGLAYHVAHQN